MVDNPWAGITNLGALEQKLFQQPPPEPASPSPAPAKHNDQTTVKPRKKAAIAEKPDMKQEKHAALPAHTRPYIRRTFDFYEDQITYLTRESLQERLSGNDLSMNAMIREAIDDWIKKRTSRK